MMDLPEMLLVHEVPVAPFLGTDGYGKDRYGAPFDLLCYVEDHRKLVRDPEGSEVISESTVFANRGPSIPARSKITLPSGRTSKVILVKDHDGGDLPVPSHLEILCE